VEVIKSGVNQSIIWNKHVCNNNSLPSFLGESQRIAEAMVRKAKPIKKVMGKLEMIP